MMKRWRWIVGIVLFLCVGWAALSRALYTAGGVNVQTTSVTSLTVPISLMPPGFLPGGAYIIKVRQGSDPILIFQYTGTLPAVAPASGDAYELTATQSFDDNILNSLAGGDVGIGVGWAAVLESGSSATVDVLYR